MDVFTPSVVFCLQGVQFLNGFLKVYLGVYRHHSAVSVIRSSQTPDNVFFGRHRIVLARIRCTDTSS